MNKTIIGRIDKITISETILNYNLDIPEQELTAKKSIRNQFEALGYDSKKITFIQQ
jgi:hypothetical protein